jgi:hypothetical protein
MNEDLRPVFSAEQLRDAVSKRHQRVTEKATSRQPVKCLEYLVTAHRDAFREHGGTVDSGTYLRDALAWIEKMHGPENVVAVNIQRDEEAPHLVAYVVPLVEVEAKARKQSVICGKNPDGTMKRQTITIQKEAGVRLSAAHFVDGRKKLSALQTDIANVVGRAHGLERGIEGSQSKHQTIRAYYAGLRAAEEPQPAVQVAALEPRVVKAGRLLAKEEREPLEDVAQRLTQQVHAHYAPIVAAAGVANAERRRRQELEATAQRQAARLNQVKPLAAAMEGLTPEQLKAVIETATKLQKANQLAAEVARRVARLAVEAAKSATTAVGRFARLAIAAIKDAGKPEAVNWPRTEGVYFQEAKAAGISLATAVNVVLEHSPGQAGISKEQAQSIAQRALNDDRGGAIGAGPRQGKGIKKGPER